MFNILSAKYSSLTFACKECGTQCDFIQAKKKCVFCDSKEFQIKTARNSIPRIETIPMNDDPYRRTTTPNDGKGQKLTMPGNEPNSHPELDVGEGIGGDENAAPFGSNTRTETPNEKLGPSSTLPKDEDPFDPYTNMDGSEYSSDALFDQGSPLHPLNQSPVDRTPMGEIRNINKHRRSSVLENLYLAIKSAKSANSAKSK